MVTIEDFSKIDVRVGEIVAVENIPEAKKPSYKLKIDFGRELVLGIMNFHRTDWSSYIRRFDIGRS